MNKLLKIQIPCILALCLFISSCGTQKQTRYTDLKYPKREFRGAWIHTIAQEQYQQMNSDQMKAYFVQMLNQLQAVGVNAVIFQVRPQADAFYKSDLEPWSRYLTGVQGQGLADGFDPLAFLIKECHKRNMELHAWLNPYRVTSAANQQLAANHIYFQHPERFLKYGSQIYFDPGIPQNREFICKVVKDIVSRYDVDAIHMDDYFYPYPIRGQEFPDKNSFDTYAQQQGFSPNQRDDWRRNNINRLVEELKHTIVATKPWVRFGISPFGIYRNKRSTSDGSGSETNGLQNYDDLYADITLWLKNSWIDYAIPQIYWEIGHKAADYSTLVDWWAKNSYGKPIYIGQDVKRTMDAKSAVGESQLAQKILQSRSHPQTIKGNCFWSGYLLMNNYEGISDELVSNYHRYKSLIPAYTAMYSHSPKKVKNLEEEYTPTSHLLRWERESNFVSPDNATYFVIYRFANGDKEDLNDATKIVTTTRNTQYILPYEGGKAKYKYVVTAVDSFHNESKGKSKKITL